MRDRQALRGEELLSLQLRPASCPLVSWEDSTVFLGLWLVQVPPGAAGFPRRRTRCWGSKQGEFICSCENMTTAERTVKADTCYANPHGCFHLRAFPSRFCTDLHTFVKVVVIEYKQCCIQLDLICHKFIHISAVFILIILTVA